MAKEADAVLSDEQIAEILARAGAATEGPWSAYHRISPRGAYKQWHIGNKDGLCQITMNGHERDYEFLAHAREDIPALCATVKALRAEKAHWEDPSDEGTCRFCGNLRDVPHGHLRKCYCIPTIKRYIQDVTDLSQQLRTLQSRLAAVERERDELRAQLVEHDRVAGLVAEALSNEVNRRID